MADLGKAYVQIVPSAKGISNSIRGQLDPEAQAAGTSAGAGIASKIKGAIKVAAIGAAVTKSIKEGARYEQAVGGIETLFKKSSDTMIKYANEAWKTAGISANDYMEQSTSFAAALMKSLGGDSKKAAEAANQAVIDMSDNANKMGTDIASIQMAYQGFSRGQYQLLDNLKIGYGGTKTEMERLLSDAEKLTGVKYDINNLSDVYEAIHAIQNELGITGTTALEASTTISGSFASMKAAASNFMAQLVAGENIAQATTDVIKSAAIFAIGNLVPALAELMMNLPQALISGLSAALPSMKQGFVTMLTKMLGESAGEAAKNANIAEMWEILKAKFVERLSSIEDIASQLWASFKAKFTEKFPSIADSANEFIGNFAKGLLNGISLLIEKFSVVMQNIYAFLQENRPMIMKKGGELLGHLITGILAALPKLLVAVGKLVITMLGGFDDLVKQLPIMGWNLMIGFFKGLTAPLVEKTRELVANVKAKLAALKTAVASIWSSIKATTASVWESIKNTISDKISAAKDKVKSIIDKIKSFFPLKIGRILSSFKLPRVDVTAKTGVLGIKYPSFSVHWNAKGAIFDRPTVLQGLGEAGPEAAIPLTTFWQKMDAMTEANRFDYDRLWAMLDAIGDRLDIEIDVDGREVGRQLKRMGVMFR